MVKTDLDKLRMYFLDRFKEMGIDPIHFEELTEKSTRDKDVRGEDAQE